MKKKIITAILSACLLAGATTPTTFAAEREEIGLYWQNAGNILGGITIDGPTGIYSLKITGKSGTTNIVATPTLYKYQNNVWREVATDWDTTYSSNSSRLVITLEFDATAGTEYKVVSEISVTTSGTVEEITNTTYSN